MAYTTAQWKDMFINWTEQRMLNRIGRQEDIAVRTLALAAEGQADAQRAMDDWYRALRSDLSSMARDRYEGGVPDPNVLCSLMEMISLRVWTLRESGHDVEHALDPAWDG
jgi:hypothetical protein